MVGLLKCCFFFLGEGVRMLIILLIATKNVKLVIYNCKLFFIIKGELGINKVG